MAGTEHDPPGPGIEPTLVVPEPKTISGKYKLGRMLGEGGMGSVYEAEHLGLAKRVAIKLLSENFAEDEVFVKRFRREARAMAAVTHDNIVQVTDTGEDEHGVPFIVMELLDGETLHQQLERAGRLAAEHTVAVLEQVAQALDEAHALGIVHRDIKPANIFLADAGVGVAVKVLDFGMAKRTGVGEPSVVTEAGRSVGTPDYMSPEQLLSAREVDHRTDQWALAVVAYRCLTGRLPFSSATFAGLCMAICTGRHAAPSLIDPRLPRALDEWFARALDVDRDQRFGSAGETIATLARTLERPATWRHVVVAVLVGMAALAVGALVALLDG
jgi:serine/threonine-protein kinase